MLAIQPDGAAWGIGRAAAAALGMTGVWIDALAVDIRAASLHHRHLPPGVIAPGLFVPGTAVTRGVRSRAIGPVLEGFAPSLILSTLILAALIPLTAAQCQTVGGTAAPFLGIAVRGRTAGPAGFVTMRRFHTAAI
jgi:hypothetical protein